MENECVACGDLITEEEGQWMKDENGVKEFVCFGCLETDWS